MPLRPPYTCPRCGYETPKRPHMRYHFYATKKTCQGIVNTLELTDEIKHHVLDNRIYHIKDEVKVMNQTINNYNTMNNIVAGMDVVDKITQYALYKHVGINAIEDTIASRYETTITQLQDNTFDVSTSKPDFMDIVHTVTSARDFRDNELLLENLNCIYDAKRKRVQVYSGVRWESQVDGITWLAGNIVAEYLEAYEMFLIRKLYGGGPVLQGTEVTAINKCIRDYYTFIACFEIQPYACVKHTDEFDEDAANEILTKYTKLYEEVAEALSNSYVKSIHKQMLDIVKSNSQNNVIDLDKSIINLVNVQPDFKRILFQARGILMEN